MKIKIKDITADLITTLINEGRMGSAKELASLAPTLITADLITTLIKEGWFSDAKELASLNGIDISDLEIDI